MNNILARVFQFIVTVGEDSIIELDNRQSRFGDGSRYNPLKVLISPQGITLFFKKSHSEYFRWNQLRSIHCHPHPDSILLGEMAPYGGIFFWTKKGLFYLTYENSVILKNYYFQHIYQKNIHMCAIYDDENKHPKIRRNFFSPYANYHIEKKIFKNGLNKSEFVSSFLLFILFLLIGLFGYYSGQIMGLIMSFVAFGIPIATIYSELFNRPIRVEVRNDGIQLFMRFGKPKNYHWGQLDYLLWNPKDRVRKTFKRKGNCALQFKGHIPYPVIDDIGFAVTEAYLAATGQNPPDKTGFD